MLACCWSLSLVSAQETAKPADKAAQVQKLIDQLGNYDYRVRENASRQLVGLGEAALPALQKATKSSDPELARRAESIMGDINKEAKQQAQRRLEEAVEKIAASNGGVDRFIDRLSLQKGFTSDEQWKNAEALARAIAGRAAHLSGTDLRAPDVLQRTLLTGANRDRLDNAGNQLIVAGTTIEQVNILESGILLVNGDIKYMNKVTNSIVFCNGNIGTVNGAMKSIFIATGNCLGTNEAEDNFFQVKAMGLSGAARNCTCINLKEIPEHSSTDMMTFSMRNKVIESEEGPLSMIKLFDPSYLGIAVTMQEGDVTIDKVLDGKLLARAGLQKGDRLMAIDKVKFDTIEEFRALLRRKSVQDEARFKLHRADRVVQLTVQFKE